MEKKEKYGKEMSRSVLREELLREAIGKRLEEGKILLNELILYAELLKETYVSRERAVDRYYAYMKENAAENNSAGVKTHKEGL